MKSKRKTRQRRIFSEQIRKQTVRDIERGKCTVSEAMRELMVSDVSIYKWIEKYSGYSQKNQLLIVENKSESYRSKELEKQLKDVEAALGRKQLEIDFLNKIIEQAGEEYKVDLKKNFSTQVSNGSGSKSIKRGTTK